MFKFGEEPIRLPYLHNKTTQKEQYGNSPVNTFILKTTHLILERLIFSCVGDAMIDAGETIESLLDDPESTHTKRKGYPLRLIVNL